MICKKLIIKGYVQGVSFRWFVKDKAIRCNVKGYVKNLRNGDVEAVLFGKEQEVHAVIDYCKRGSSQSRVDEVLIQDCNQTFDSFEIRY